jgi:molybdate/tungstate transport system substrate-binding protein
MRLKLSFLSLIFIVFFSCNNSKTQKTNSTNTDSVAITGKVVIFHAGSMSFPLRKLKEKFEEKNPGSEILLEGAGSLECARKITDLKKYCDIFASADYKIIDNMLIPEYTDSNFIFASNEIIIAFTDKSKFASEINNKNWFQILQKPEVIFGRAEPNNDPCGYRTVMTWQLADDFYGKKDIEKNFLKKNKEFVRPKEMDLISLIETNSLDYIFVYKSVATQNNLRYVQLPDEINLSNKIFSSIYKNSSIEVSGKKPGETITFVGEPIIYGITLLKQAEKNVTAKEFLKFVLSEEGKNIISKSGFKGI